MLFRSGRAPGGAVTPVFSANEAPTNTLVVVSPERGETPTVAFDVEATNCADVDLPLTYSFSHACSKSGGACDDLGGEYTALAETSFAARAGAPLQSDLLLPAGYGTRGGEGDVLVLVAYCYDALGAKGRAQKDAAISSPPKETQKAVAVANAETWIAESNATGDLDGVLRAIALTQSFLDEDVSERRRLDTCDPGFYGGDCSLRRLVVLQRCDVGQQRRLAVLQRRILAHQRRLLALERRHPALERRLVALERRHPADRKSVV